MQAPATAVFRVDASRAIGIGHFVRCLRLADGLRGAGTRTIVIARGLTPALAAMAVSRGHEHAGLGEAPQAGVGAIEAVWPEDTQREDATATARALGGVRADWVIVDHYGLDATWEREVRPACTRLLAIDDLANRPHDADVLLDQNYYADAAVRYDRWVPAQTVRLFGPRFALLDEAFHRRREGIAPRTGPVRRILVCFGGSDERDFTGLVLRAIDLLPAPRPDVEVVVGAEHARRAAIADLCRERGWVCHTQTDRMADLMAAADLAAGAGGSMTWERCALGLPALVFTLAENQRRVVSDGAAAGLLYAPDDLERADAAFIARHLTALIENAPLRGLISRAGLQAVDGRGVQRVLRHLGVADVDIREATLDDARRVFEWRNDPAVRRVSFETGAIAWEQHERWFARVLADPDRHLLIGMRDGTPIGVVRFDLDGSHAEVSIYLVPGEARPGTGGALLQAAEGYLRRVRPGVVTSVAAVRHGNPASHGMFLSAGYTPHTVRYEKALTS